MARTGAAASAVVVVVMMALVQGSMAAKYTVGGTTGWQLSPNQLNFYQDWEHSTAPFYSTDSLEFRWIATDSVLQVTFDAFTTCNLQGPIQAWTADPFGQITTMLFPLKDYAFHTLYFISGDVGHCLNGQKFFIDVLQ